MLHVRKAIEQDFEKIMEIYRYAQDFMIQSGNPDQWGHFYPDRELVKADIRDGLCHVICDETEIHGIFRCAADYCKSVSANVRIDTHENNTTMQRQIEKSGFKRCGTIYVEDGSPRIAYQWSADPS